MTEVWQNVIVLGIIAAAIGYTARRAWRRGRSREPSGCPACSECTRWWKAAFPGSDDTSGAHCAKSVAKGRQEAPD